MKAKWFSTLLIVIMLAVAMVPAAGAASGLPPEESVGTNSDNGHHPLGDKRANLMAKALDAKLHGKATGKVYKVAKGQYVELAREGEDKIWSVLGEFGTAINPVTGGTPGPLHNQIPQPDRTVDNTSIWNANFTKSYYENLLFSQAPGAVSMRNFYIEQSSNRYTVNGEVTDWVRSLDRPVLNSRAYLKGE